VYRRASLVATPEYGRRLTGARPRFPNKDLRERRRTGIGLIVRRFERLLITGACLVVLIAGMRAAASLIVPFLLAVFITIIMAPVYASMRQRGISNLTSMLVLMLGLVILGFGVFSMISTSINQFTGQLPEYQNAFQERTEELRTWLKHRGVQPEKLALEQYWNATTLFRYAGSMATSASALLGQGLFILLLVIFMLLEMALLPGKVQALPGISEQGLAGLKQVVGDVRRYMGIKTLTSLLTGALVGLWAFVLKLDTPVLLGVLAFMLNYVPNLGSIIAAVPGLLLAWIQYGGGTALLCGVGYLIINIGISNFLEPRFMGRGLGLSPLVILMAMFFWGWVLGPVGMLLSVPLSMAAKIALESDPGTRWLAVLMGTMPEARSRVRASEASPDRDPGR